MHLGHTERSKVMQVDLGHAPLGTISSWTFVLLNPPRLLKYEKLTNAVPGSKLNRNHKLISLSVILCSNIVAAEGGLSRGT